MSIDFKKSSAIRYMEKLTGGPLTLGRCIWAIRHCEEKSQAEFAKKLEISRQQLCDIEQHRKSVSPRLAAKYACILGYDEEVFVHLALEDSLAKAGLNYSVEIKKRRGRPKVNPFWNAGYA